MSKDLGRKIDCRDKNSPWHLNGFPKKSHRVNRIISGRSPPLYCTLTLITMQGHQNHNQGAFRFFFEYSESRCTIYLDQEFRTTVCVFCVLFPFILDIKFVGRTSRGHTGGRSHRISHPPSFCGACPNFSRDKDSAIPFPRRP